MVSPPWYSHRLRGHTHQFSSLNCHHRIHIWCCSPPSDPYIASKSNLDSYQYEPTLFISPSRPMVGAPTNRFHGGTTESGLITTFPIILGIPFVISIAIGPSGPLATAHTSSGPLTTSGGPTSSSMVHTIPSFMHGGIGPSTTISTIHTIWVTTPTIKSKPYQPPFSSDNYIPTSPSTIVGHRRSSLGPSIPFMASLKLPDLAWLTNEPILHDPLWPPIPTKLP